MIRVREFCLEDLDHITPLYGESHAITKALALEQCDSSWTVFDDGAIIACGGVMPTTPGVGTAWLYVDKTVAEYKRSAAGLRRLCRFSIEAVMRMKNLRRVQATVFLTNPAAVAFALSIGFQSEGMLRKFGPNGEDAIMFSCVDRSPTC